MTRASKPGVPTKSTGDQDYASEMNAVDTAIDAVIDDYVSQTDTTGQEIAAIDSILYTPQATAPTASEGQLYYSSGDHKLVLRDDSGWRYIPATSGGNYKLTPAYTVYVSAGTYYAMDEDGNEDYSESAFRTLMNTVITAVNTAGGGLVFIKAGDYPVTQEVTLLSDVDLRGEGKSTRLYLPNGQPTVTTQYTILEANAQDNIHVSYMHLDLNITNNGDDRGYAWVAKNGDNLRASYLWITDCNRYGIYWILNDGAAHYNWHTEHCVFDYIHEDGCEYYIDGVGGSELYGMSINNNYFTDILHVAAAFTGPSADAHCGGGEICNNVFYDWNPDAHWAPVDPSTQHGQAVQVNGQGALVANNTVHSFLRGFETQAANANYNQFLCNTVIGGDLGGTNNYTREAFKINNGDHNIVAYNTIISPPTDDIGGNGSMVRCENVDDTRFIENTFIRQAGNGQSFYAFQEQAGNTTNTIYRRNRFINMPTPYLNAIESSASFDSISFPFVQGSTFLSAGGASWGWEIDLGAEYAIAIGRLPADANYVQRITIHAVGLAAPGAGAAMNLQIDGFAGTNDEAEGTETIAVATKENDTDNFAANDYIQWVLTSSDDADIDDIQGGDTLQIKVQHDAAGGGDVATDAVFHTVEVEYV